MARKVDLLSKCEIFESQISYVPYSARSLDLVAAVVVIDFVINEIYLID
jgi:hypothetical protein